MWRSALLRTIPGVVNALARPAVRRVAAARRMSGMVMAAQPVVRATTRSLVSRLALRSMATKVFTMPQIADSVTEGTLQSFNKKVGDAVKEDEVIAVFETDKVAYDFQAKASGVITKLFPKVGDVVRMGDNVVEIDVGAAPAASASQPAPEAPKTAHAAPAAAAPAAPKPAAPKAEAPKAADKPAPAPAAATAKAAPAPMVLASGSREERRVPMSRMRQRIAERLKDSQNTYALLTTFNDIDMSNLMSLREDLKQEFQEKHKVKLGFMSGFVKAAASALRASPIINAVIDGSDIVYRDYVDISVAVSTPTGLVVPVLRDVDRMSFADVEKAIHELGTRARDGKLTIPEMQGGTFTISNGGVYGSMMGTPILNPPQSAILGMHGVNKRPVVVNDQIVIRPMMYVALTYDHRLIDGREAVLFLRHIKACVEDPRRLLLDL